MRYLVTIAGLAFVIVQLGSTSAAATIREQGDDAVGTFATLTIENDLFAGKDGGYTNGIGYSWGYGPYDDYLDSSAPGWLTGLSDFLFIEMDDQRKKAVSYAVFQMMQTPEDIQTTELIDDDLPYAGMLGWKGTLYAWDNEVADQFYVIAGMVGPASLAESTQKLVHQLTGSKRPQGWDNQLHNELVFNVAAQRSWRVDMTNSNGFGSDFLTFASGSAGTFSSEVAASAMLRFGSGLEETFPAVSILPGRDINPLAGSTDSHFYTFIAAQASYVFNDIFVDGNTFRNSHAVTLKHERFIVSAGAVWNWDKWGLLFSVAETSSTFEENDHNGRFGSLSISYRF
ncbi:lipid A deacylase LpxR family protein [Kangiella shandongensis]|uniref:lipid A deacylase LpxR family protein n=1 Tax=Kangiella shandongensis TaxID=2763258 RepID=UPI001CBD8C10|nr:lipid A deacylase LpxR family protein [Kangiella shandongensis]